MSAFGGKADLFATGSECLLLAEAVEKVPASRILETMIQSGTRDRINVTQRAAVMNDRCENFRGEDFFNSLSQKRTWQVLTRLDCPVHAWCGLPWRERPSHRLLR